MASNGEPEAFVGGDDWLLEQDIGGTPPVSASVATKTVDLDLKPEAIKSKRGSKLLKKGAKIFQKKSKNDPTEAFLVGKVNVPSVVTDTVVAVPERDSEREIDDLINSLSKPKVSFSEDSFIGGAKKKTEYDPDDFQDAEHGFTDENKVNNDNFKKEDLETYVAPARSPDTSVRTQFDDGRSKRRSTSSNMSKTNRVSTTSRVVSQSAKFDHLKGMTTSEKFATLSIIGDPETYSSDCYSFIAVHSPFKKPFFFFFGVMVFVFQAAFLLYMILNKMHGNWGINGEVDNPSNGFFGSKLPSNVTGLVRATQITAVLCYIVFADSSLKDCALGVEQFPRLDRAMEDDQIILAMISCILRFSQGVLAIIATFLLIITSDDVIDIILNFAAVNFISSLDEVGFELAKWGKYGPALEREAKAIEERPIPYCFYRKDQHVRYLFTVIPIGLFLIGAMASVAYWQESSKLWVTQTIRVQFDDSTNLERYSGCFHMDPDAVHNRRKNYNSHGTNAETGVIGYCKEKMQWVLFNLDDDDENHVHDPCLVDRDHTLAHSHTTSTFDIYTTTEDTWFSASGTPLDLYFFESEEEGIDLQENCGSFLNNGKCDLVFNTIGYQYDGGDCCATTCNHPDCGRGGVNGTFGSINTLGIGFHYCVNPELVPMTIMLNSVTSSRDPDVMNVTDTQIEGFLRKKGFSFWDETPVGAFFNVDCDHQHILSMFIDGSMEGELETVYVQDGAHCEISVSNITDSEVHWDNTPIWWLNYTIYQGYTLDNEMISGFSGELDYLAFDRIPECYFHVLHEYIDNDNFYVAQTEFTDAVFWLHKDPSDYSDCDNPFLIERFALSAFNWAAPIVPEAGDITRRSAITEGDYISSADDTSLWIASAHQCRWENVVCNNGAVETLIIRYLNMDGHFSTSIGLLTELKLLEIEECSLYGTVPSEIGLLTKLTGLNIDTNELTGSIPTELGHITNMIELDLDFNHLTGTIPTELGNMKSAVDFDLHGNHLTGHIPSEIFSLTHMELLWFDNNELSGSVPTTISRLNKLNDLLVADNKMTGTIPTEVGDLRDLRRLHFENNHFSGSIPTEIGYLTFLLVLDLRGNDLTGSIPSEIGTLTELREIRLEGNKLTGTIPYQLSYLQRLVVFTSDDGIDENFPLDIRTKDSCSICNGEHYDLSTGKSARETYYENGEFGIDSFSCKNLLKIKHSPDPLLSSKSCRFIRKNCVTCGSGPFVDNFGSSLPTKEPTALPAVDVSESPTDSPTEDPTSGPSYYPVGEVSDEPSPGPTSEPTVNPTEQALPDWMLRASSNVVQSVTDEPAAATPAASSSDATEVVPDTSVVVPVNTESPVAEEGGPTFPPWMAPVPPP